MNQEILDDREDTNWEEAVGMHLKIPTHTGQCLHAKALTANKYANESFNCISMFFIYKY